MLSGIAEVHAEPAPPRSKREIVNEQSTQDTINKRSYSSSDVVDYYLQFDSIFEVEKVILQKLRSSIKDKKLLDIGIGGGRTTKYLIELSEDYTGIDYTPEFVRIVKTKYPNVTILHGDARDLRIFQDDTFDFVLFSFNGIDTVAHESRLRTLSEVRRVLKPLGYFMFSTHNRDYKYSNKLPWQEDTPLGIAHIKNCLYALIHWPKHLIMKKHEIYADEYSILNDDAHGFSLLHYYIRIEAQVNQLQRTGFSDIEVYNMEGNRVKSDVDFPWAYYVARKPLRQ